MNASRKKIMSMPFVPTKDTHKETKSNYRKRFEERLAVNRMLDDILVGLGLETLRTD